MEGPPTPKLSPIMRRMSMIPTNELAAQVISMDRLGTWHLARALRLAEHMAENPADDEKWRNGLMDRHLKLAGALLGSINARVATFKFLQEVKDGQHADAGGDPDAYERAQRS